MVKMVGPVGSGVQREALGHWGHTFEAECGILDLPLFLLLPDHEVSSMCRHMLSVTATCLYSQGPEAT